MYDSRLRNLLSLVDDMHPLSQKLALLKHSHAKHNMTVLHKNGYVTGITRTELPPSWVISAMRYLAKCMSNKSVQSAVSVRPGLRLTVRIMRGVCIRRFQAFVGFKIFYLYYGMSFVELTYSYSLSTILV